MWRNISSVSIRVQTKGVGRAPTDGNVRVTNAKMRFWGSLFLKRSFINFVITPLKN